MSREQFRDETSGKAWLSSFLITHGVPVHTWGTGEAKTFDHLYQEVSSGEATLTVDGDRVIRSAEGSTVTVYYRDGARLLRLVEAKQVFKDGRERVRNLPTSVGEKLAHGEDPYAAAHRALTEELGITERLTLYLDAPSTKGPIPSPSFPGLYTRYTMHNYHVYLPEDLYHPEGYVERQKDKSSYFVWEVVSENS